MMQTLVGEKLQPSAIHRNIIKPFEERYLPKLIKFIDAILNGEFHLNIDVTAPLEITTGIFWLALDNEEIIGSIALLNLGNQQAALRKMFVHKQYRGKNFAVGEKLMQTLLSFAKDNGFNEIYLGTIDAFKAAQRFYEKHGWIEVAQDQLPANFSALPLDTKFYCYRLK